MVLRKFRNRHDSPWIEASEGEGSINPSHYQLPGAQFYSSHGALNSFELHNNLGLSPPFEVTWFVLRNHVLDQV